jgi:hypothetical protein
MKGISPEKPDSILFHKKFIPTLVIPNFSHLTVESSFRPRNLPDRFYKE